MGIASVDTFVAPTEEPDNAKKEATPTFLSGESLTFPLIAGVGTAAITMYAAALSVEPSVGIVIIVAILCGIIITVWGLVDAKAAATNTTTLTKGDYFKRITIGALNTILLAAALWGTVAVSQAAYATG